MATPITTFPIATTFAVTEWGLAVNVKDFGAVGDGVADDTIAIQAAIDYCFTTDTFRRTIFVPGGKYKTTLPIYVDPPGAGSLRGDGGGLPAAWNSGTTYASGNTVTFLGIPWVSQVNGNLNHTPVLPPKAMNGSVTAGAIVEWHGLYWIALVNTTVADLFAGTVGKWATTTIYWLPYANTNPQVANWAATLLGEEGLDAQGDGFGSVLYPTFNNTTALWSCHGNGNTIKNISLIGPLSDSNDAWNYRAGQPANGVGIGIPGGNGGASRTLIENCGVFNFNNGIRVSTNSDGLGDSNMITKTHIGNCGSGIGFAGSQNFINTVDRCNISCTSAIVAIIGQGCNVIGGNFSCNSSAYGAFAISAITATPLATSNPWTLNVSVTLTAPGNPTQQGYRNSLNAGILDHFFIETARFGVIPFTVVSFDPVTGILNLTALNYWYGSYWINTFVMNPATDTAIKADIEAATFVYGIELPTLFRGSSFNVDGAFLEQSVGCPTTLIDSSAGFGSQGPSRVNIFYDYNAVFPFAADDTRGLHYGSVLVGHVIAGSAPVTIEGSSLGCSSTSGPARLIFDITSSIILKVRDNTRLFANCRVFGGRATDADVNMCRGLGGGEWDSADPFQSAPNEPQFLYNWATNLSLGKTAQWGYRPIGGYIPWVTVDQVDTLSGTLPALTTTAAYPMIWGGQLYQVMNDQGFPNASGLLQREYQIVSEHSFYTYGQDLTTSNIAALSWSYKGQSYAVYVTSTSNLAWSFLMPGLGVILNNGAGGGDILYIISAVYPTLGYFTVERPQGNSTYLVGDKNTVFTGNVIKQQPFSVKRFNIPERINFQTPANGASIALSNSDTELIMKPAGTIAGATVTMCSIPFDGQRIRMKSSQTITALSVSPNAGQSVAGAPSTIGAGILVEGLYRKADTTWYF